MSGPGEPSWSVTDPLERLLGYLDWYRGIVAAKLAGLSAAELRTSPVPSGWTPLELVNHLVFMERRWLVWGFAAEAVGDPWGDDDPVTGRWTVPADVGVDEVVTRLVESGRRTRQVTAGADLATPARTGGRFGNDRPPPDLGWILDHVLQEYARHAGHLDIARELADGAVGEC